MEQKNKVQDWRDGTEKDISDVLQSESVFLNVSKGQMAKQDDLKKAFGSATLDEIVKMILDKGEVQVGGKEREAQLESMKKEIATGVAERCIDPESGRPHTVSMIEKALDGLHFNVQPTKSTKSQVRVLQTLLTDNDDDEKSC